MPKKIVFLSGTRADFGKLKSLIASIDQDHRFEIHLFVTGMHMLSKYGMTVLEVEKSSFKNIFRFINQRPADSMDVILAKTISGLSDYVKELRPDMIIIHGDRVEAMAGAIVGSLNNILVAHIEGGEVSGTIDELIRHSVSKMSHIHLVCNSIAKKRLLQLGEKESSIKIIGSPDLDLMISNTLPTLNKTKHRYKITFDKYVVFIYHPVTTERRFLERNIREIVNALVSSKKNYIVIYPNNDDGSNVILDAILPLRDNKKFRIFPSIRFEYFLTLLKNSEFIIGNSSTGVREAPFYGIPTINLGSRQQNRSDASTIANVEENFFDIKDAIDNIPCIDRIKTCKFGEGNSHILFKQVMQDEAIWKISTQKFFVDINVQEK